MSRHPSLEAVKEEIKRELPAIPRTDPDFRVCILDLTRQAYANRSETQDRFWEVAEQVNRDREEQNRKWEANQAELRQIREDHNRRWVENQGELKRLHEEHMAYAKKYDHSIGALARAGAAVRESIPGRPPTRGGYFANMALPPS